MKLYWNELGLIMAFSVIFLLTIDWIATLIVRFFPAEESDCERIPVYSEDELRKNANIFKAIKQNYPLSLAMYRHFPQGIRISTKDSRPVLYIDGDDLTPTGWEHELCFLEFIDIPNYLTEVHLNNLPLNWRIISYLFRLLAKNSSRIQILTINGCFLHKNSEFDWDLSLFSCLTCFKISNTKLSALEFFIPVE